jgi:hypothetical protein
VELEYDQTTQYVQLHGTVFIPKIILVISYMQLAFLESNHISYCIIKTNLLIVYEL